MRDKPTHIGRQGEMGKLYYSLRLSLIGSRVMRPRLVLEWTRRQITKLGMKMDRIFLLPPSFFALVGGTFLSIAIDLLKTLLSAQETQINYVRMMLLSISAIAISTGSFLFLSVKLDGLRGKFPVSDLHEAGIRGGDSRGKRTVWRQLWYAFLIGFFFVCLGFTSLALGYFVFRNQGVVDC